MRIWDKIYVRNWVRAKVRGNYSVRVKINNPIILLNVVHKHQHHYSI